MKYDIVDFIIEGIKKTESRPTHIDLFLRVNPTKHLAYCYLYAWEPDCDVKKLVFQFPVDTIGTINIELEQKLCWDVIRKIVENRKNENSE